MQHPKYQHQEEEGFFHFNPALNNSAVVSSKDGDYLKIVEAPVVFLCVAGVFVPLWRLRFSDELRKCHLVDNICSVRILGCVLKYFAHEKNTAHLKLRPVSESFIRQSEVFVKSEEAIRGYDPVAYFKAGKPVEGKDALSYTWKGAVWKFSSEENRKALKPLRKNSPHSSVAIARMEWVMKRVIKHPHLPMRGPLWMENYT
jgi:hypothetical protein